MSRHVDALALAQHGATRDQLSRALNVSPDYVDVLLDDVVRLGLADIAESCRTCVPDPVACGGCPLTSSFPHQQTSVTTS